MADEEKPKKSTFERVTDAAIPKGFFNRNTEGLLLSETGVAKLNVGGTAVLNGLAMDRKLDPEKYVIGLEVSIDEMRIAVYAEKAGEAEGQLGLRRYKGKSPVVGFHLGGVLLRYPKLKAAYTRDCQVSSDVDDAGKACMMINLRTALNYVGSGKKGVRAAKPGTDTNGKDGEGAGAGSGSGSGEETKDTGAAPSDQQ